MDCLLDYFQWGIPGCCGITIAGQCCGHCGARDLSHRRGADLHPLIIFRRHLGSGVRDQRGASAEASCRRKSPPPSTCRSGAITRCCTDLLPARSQAPLAIHWLIVSGKRGVEVCSMPMRWQSWMQRSQAKVIWQACQEIQVKERVFIDYHWPTC